MTLPWRRVSDVTQEGVAAAAVRLWRAVGLIHEGERLTGGIDLGAGSRIATVYHRPSEAYVCLSRDVQIALDGAPPYCFHASLSFILPDMSVLPRTPERLQRHAEIVTALFQPHGELTWFHTPMSETAVKFGQWHHYLPVTGAGRVLPMPTLEEQAAYRRRGWRPFSQLSAALLEVNAR
jgi:hypothetical protein